jgi:putative RecB family exonuclease
VVYSHSKLETYRNCPLSFKLRYIDGVRTGREGVEAFMGSRVHEALEKLYRDLRMCKPMSEDELVEAYNALWERSWHDGVEVVRKEYGPEHYRAVGEKALRDYYRRYHPFDDGVTVWLEKKVDIPLDEAGCYRMTGVVDRLTARDGGVYEVHDYKTSQTLPEQPVLDADRQLALYQMAVESAFPDAREVRLVWHYLVFGKELESRRTPQELDGLRQETIQLIREIEAAREFPPRESVLCDWCEYQPLCPLRKHLVEVEELPPARFAADEGVRLADRYAELNAAKRAAEAEMKRLREDIAAYCRRHGVEKLRGSESLVSVRFTRSPAFPGAGEGKRVGLEEALRAMGRWEEVSSLDTRKLCKVVADKKWPDGQLTLLDPYVSWVESVTVTVSKLR